MAEIVYRRLDSIRTNPKNPRKADSKKIKALAESIKANPLFFEARPILLSDRTGELVIIGGEQRSKAAALLGLEEVPTILLSGLSEEREDEIMILDNTHAGIWDEAKLKELKEYWGEDKLKGWGAELKEEKWTEKLSGLQYKSMYYEPQGIPDISLSSCINFDKFNAKIKVVEESGLNKEAKNILKWFCYRFLKIDFQRVAEYYYFKASDKEKEVIERLRLVLIDGGGEGFIEDDLLRLAQIDNESEDD